MSKKRLDSLFWFMMYLLPIFCFFVIYFRSGTFEAFHMYIGSEWAFSWVSNVLDSITYMAFEETFYLTGYISYLVSVEIIHCFFDVIVFIPRFAHSLIDYYCERINKHEK